MCIRSSTLLLLHLALFSCLCTAQDNDSTYVPASNSTVAMRIAVGVTMPVLLIFVGLGIRHWRHKNGYEYVPGTWRKRENAFKTEGADEAFMTNLNNEISNLEKGNSPTFELPAKDAVHELPTQAHVHEMPAESTKDGTAALVTRDIKGGSDGGQNAERLAVDSPMSTMRVDTIKISGAVADEKQQMTFTGQAPEIQHEPGKSKRLLRRLFKFR